MTMELHWTVSSRAITLVIDRRPFGRGDREPDGWTATTTRGDSMAPGLTLQAVAFLRGCAYQLRASGDTPTEVWTVADATTSEDPKSSRPRRVERGGQDEAKAHDQTWHRPVANEGE
jgi:hypothetical protein